MKEKDIEKDIEKFLMINISQQIDETILNHANPSIIKGGVHIMNNILDLTKKSKIEISKDNVENIRYSAFIVYLVEVLSWSTYLLMTSVSNVARDHLKLSNSVAEEIFVKTLKSNPRFLESHNENFNKNFNLEHKKLIMSAIFKNIDIIKNEMTKNTTKVTPEVNSSIDEILQKFNDSRSKKREKNDV